VKFTPLVTSNAIHSDTWCRDTAGLRFNALWKRYDAFLFNQLDACKRIFLDMWTTWTGPDRLIRDFDADKAIAALQGCDLFLSFAEWQSPSLSKLMSETRTVSSVGRYDDFTFNLWRPEDEDKHQFDAMFAIAERIFPGYQIDQFFQALKFSDAVRGAGDEILQASGGDFWIGFHPEGSLREKSCPYHLISDIVRCLVAWRTDAVIFIFGLEKQYFELELLSRRVIVLNRLPLELAAYLVSRMNVFVGVDSCFLHIADLCRVPGVGLFGPTFSERFGFRFARHVHIQSQAMNIDGSQVTAAMRSLVRGGNVRT